MNSSKAVRSEAYKGTLAFFLTSKPRSYVLKSTHLRGFSSILGTMSFCAADRGRVGARH